MRRDFPFVYLNLISSRHGDGRQFKVVHFFKRLLLGPWLDLDVEVGGPLVKPAVLF
jgi:hypothetical protein